MPSYDLVIIGGGIHGVGVAQAAAASGYRALLLERDQLASGTSSRSSKLIHGGLRYLETGQLRLVRESLREREILLTVAPGLVRLLAFHLPIYTDSTRRPWQIRAGLSLYTLLGNLARDTRFRALPRSEWGKLDGLKTEKLQAVFRYSDAQTDDALLTRAIMRSAISLGAELACPARFISASRQQDGYQVRYVSRAQEPAGKNPPHEEECHCRVLVNAAGAWVHHILATITPAPPKLAIDLVQGAHIVVEGRLAQGVYYTEAPYDRRAVFIMPWQGHTLVGTTESPYTGDLALVQPLPGEIAYLQETLRHYFPAHKGRLVIAFAGLRVLPKNDRPAFYRSRETILFPDDTRRPKLITVYGGKLTGYRATGEKIIQLLQPSLPARKQIADTAQLSLVAE
jgi:glycerol-3-phosphate dehydrogenase